MAIVDQKFDIKFNVRTIRFLSMVGLFASITVITCNTILYAYGDIADWPQWALNLAYWGGSIVLAFAALGFIPTYFALKPSGMFWSISSAGFLAYFVALGSAGHGSFFPLYSILQAVENSPGHPPLDALVSPFRTYTNVLLLTCVLSLFLGSVLYSITVALKTTLYPRWMAVWNPFAIAFLTIVPSQIEGIPLVIKVLSQGIGFHLALGGHFILTYYVLKKSTLKQDD